MKDCTDCIRKNDSKYTKCYCVIYKEHPEQCNYKIRFTNPKTKQAEASTESLAEAIKLLKELVTSNLIDDIQLLREKAKVYLNKIK